MYEEHMNKPKMLLGVWCMARRQLICSNIPAPCETVALQNQCNYNSYVHL